MKQKYGFDSKWSMSMYSKLFYDKFFEYYPNIINTKYEKINKPWGYELLIENNKYYSVKKLL